jgi:hypothetical protein
MQKMFTAMAFVFALTSSHGFGDQPTVDKQKSAATFEKLKSLAGTWYEANQDGTPSDKIASEVRVTAGGSAVHETLYPGQPMEMISVYHLDGADLVMTHYCVLKNQPRLKADPTSPANQIRWVFVGGSNLDPSKDTHMHSSTVTFVDEDHLELQGEAWENGKPSPEHCGMLKLVRMK